MSQFEPLFEPHFEPHFEPRFSGGANVPVGALANYQHDQTDVVEAITELVNRQSVLLTVRASDVNAEQTNGSVRTFGPGEAALIIRVGVLIQGVATNEITNNEWAGTGGTNGSPDLWTGFTLGGTSDRESSSALPSVQATRFIADNERPFFQSGFFAVTVGTKVCLSVLIEDVVSGSITAGNFLTSFLSGATGTLTHPVCEANPSGGSSGIIVSGILFAVFDVTSSGNLRMRCGIGSGGNATGEILASLTQAELGSFPSSRIITMLAPDTRLADESTVSTANFPTTDFKLPLPFEFRGSDAVDGRIAVSGTAFDMHYDDVNGRYELITALGTVVSNAIAPVFGDEILPEVEVDSVNGATLTINGSAGPTNAAVTSIAWDAATLRYMNNLAGTAATNAVVHTATIGPN